MPDTIPGPLAPPPPPLGDGEIHQIILDVITENPDASTYELSESVLIALKKYGVIA